MKFRAKRVLALAGIIVIIALVLAGNIWRSRTATGKGVWVEVARPESIETTIFSTGEVEPSGLVEVRADVTGILEEVRVESGDRVTEGIGMACYRLQDLLDRKVSAESALASALATLVACRSQAGQGAEEARINLEMAEMALTEAREDYEEALRWPPWDERRIDATRTWEKAQAQYDLARINAERIVVSPEDLRAAEAAYRVAEYQLKQANEDLENAEISSPRDGIVLGVHVDDGHSVSAGQLLFEVSDPLRVKVKAKVDEMDIAQVETDQAARVTTQAYPDMSFDGRVTWIAPSAERDGNVAYFWVEVEIDNREALLRPGMSVDIDFIVESTDASVSIPLEAVRDRAGAQVVFVVENGLVREREVSTGASNGSRMEVTLGLKAGETVVTGPTSSLKSLTPGTRVRVEDRE